MKRHITRDVRATRLLRRILVILVAAPLLPLAGYALLLLYATLTDQRAELAEPPVGIADFSRLSRAQRVTVIRPEADTQLATAELQQLVRDAAAQGRKITIAGAKHSMGGHTLLDGSLCIDMRSAAFRTIGPVIESDGVGTVRVGAGVTWHELLATLDREGWSVAVMQSNDDFTIGGSISVNCHGWDPASPPIDSTVEGFRILLANGSVRECRRDRPEDRELFRAVCGGYGLLGILLDADLRVVRNALYRAEEFSATTETYAERLQAIVPARDRQIGLAYGRISVAPGPWFLHDARIIRFVANGRGDAAPRNTVAENGGGLGPASWEIAIARAAFRASTLSNFGKLGRWSVERIHGQTHRIVSRNGILQTPSDWFANRDPAFTEILHEYFVPPERLAEFFGRIRAPLREQPGIDLLNITIRRVEPDQDSLLAYAPQSVLGLVMLFRYSADSDADEKMRRLTGFLIDAALNCGGSYYLPYRLHARREQFERAYPQAKEFYALKLKYDPSETFQNTFYTTYLRPAD